MSERSQRYLYYITQEVERRGMPSEIALLPVIESAFNPGAYSVGRASGIWQFIPSTGKNFGMQQNWWYDGRRDIISATNGALDYLQKLHDQFGDWELALAAYNWGEGAVSRAQTRNRRLHKPTDFSNLNLPRETRNYVPKLLAVKHIINDPEHFGLKLAGIPNQPYFAAVSTAHPIDVKLAAELADVSMEEFLALNPGHNRPVILQENATVLLLPVDKLETFQTNLEKNNQRLVSWQPYQTKKGDRFDQLAPRFGLSAEKLRSINGLSARAKFSSGQTLLVPLDSETPAETEFAAFNTNLVSIDDTAGRTFKHTVRRGENISIIAHHYHISQARLLELNSGISKLRVGQRITVAEGSGRTRRNHLAKSHANRNAKLVHSNKEYTGNSNINLASNR
jgi:membrane-bound lytic murein transglycosylase D